MGASHVVVYGVVGLVMAVLAVTIAGYAVSRLRERRMPFERRLEKVRAALRGSESATGATSIRSHYVSGVPDDLVREVAETEGYWWTGYAGRNDSTLTFQREVPGEKTTENGPEPAPGMDLLLARLAKLRPDIGGLARLPMDNGMRLPRREYDEIFAAHGWEYHSVEHHKGVTHWVLKRPGTPAVDRRDPYFLKGPSLDELRQHPAAAQAAARAKRDFGVDPLSGTALRQAREQHLKYYRKGVRYGGVGSVSLLVLIVVVLAAARHLGNAAVYVPAALLVIAMIVGFVKATQAMRQRKAATSDYQQAYERVVQAVIRPSG